MDLAFGFGFGFGFGGFVCPDPVPISGNVGISSNWPPRSPELEGASPLRSLVSEDVLRSSVVSELASQHLYSRSSSDYGLMLHVNMRIC